MMHFYVSTFKTCTTGKERHYISDPQSDDGCERLVLNFKNTTQFIIQ